MPTGKEVINQFKEGLTDAEREFQKAAKLIHMD
jgi:hypothetical protein